MVDEEIGRMAHSSLTTQTYTSSFVNDSVFRTKLEMTKYARVPTWKEHPSSTSLFTRTKLLAA